MTEFWTIFGRMASQKAYRDAIQAAAPATLPANPPFPNTINFDGPSYAAMKLAVRTGYAGPVSIITLGELLRIGKQDYLNAFFNAEPQAGALAIIPQNLDPSKDYNDYYTALGMMITNPSARLAVDKGFAPDGLPALKGTDQLKTLRAIASSLSIPSNVVCGRGWGQGCHQALDHYDGHLHSVAVSVPVPFLVVDRQRLRLLD